MIESPRVAFYEPCGPAVRRGMIRGRRTMPTIFRHPVSAAIVWTVLIFGTFAYVLRHPARDREALIGAGVCLYIGWPAMLFTIDLWPARVRLTRRGVGSLERWVPVGRVRQLTLRRVGEAAMLAIDDGGPKRRRFVVPPHARQAVMDYVDSMPWTINATAEAGT